MVWLSGYISFFWFLVLRGWSLLIKDGIVKKKKSYEIVFIGPSKSTAAKLGPALEGKVRESLGSPAVQEHPLPEVQGSGCGGLGASPPTPP